MKIAVVAMFISPYKGSERSVAWNYVKHISKVHDLTVYYAMDKEDIESYELSDVSTKVKVKYVQVDLKHQISQNMLLHRYYKIKNWNKWQRQVKNLIAKESGNYDLIHYVGPIGFMEPGYLYELNKPYIWGPISGVHTWPQVFLKYPRFDIYLQFVSRFLMYFPLFCSKSVRNAFEDTDVILSATPETHYQIKKYFNRVSIILPENGIEIMETTRPVDISKGLHIFFNGGNDYRKGFLILLDALAFVKGHYTLHVVGDDDNAISSDFKKYVQRKGVKNIIWHGQRTRAEVQEILLACNLNIITSASEGNPTIIWEAMSKGIPTLSFDYCGMSNVICNKCGIKIPVKSHKEVIEAISCEIEAIISDPSILLRLSEGVLECAKKYLWKNRVAFFNETYQNAIEIHAKNKNLNFIKK